MNAVCLNDLVVLHLAVVENLGLLDVVMFVLDSVETLDLVLGHGTLLFGVLNESDHSLGALGIKLIVVITSNGSEGFDSAGLSLGEWVSRESFLHIVPKICNKSDSILQLDIKGLIVDVGPLSVDNALVTGALLLAEDSLGLVVFHQVDVVQTMVVAELEVVLLVHNLDFVGNSMSADLTGVKQINNCAFVGNIELPVSVKLLSQAMHRLVSLDNVLREWVEVANEASHS